MPGAVAATSSQVSTQTGVARISVQVFGVVAAGVVRIWCIWCALALALSLLKLLRCRIWLLNDPVGAGAAPAAGAACAN